MHACEHKRHAPLRKLKRECMCARAAAQVRSRWPPWPQAAWPAAMQGPSVVAASAAPGKRRRLSNKKAD
eukprot:2175274-Lingulodinium_polyedra.AAC.1